VARDDARIAALASRVVGRIAADFSRRPNEAGESALGDLVADAQLAATASPGNGGAQLALTNPGGMRTDLVALASGPDAGNVTYGAVFAAQPFNNRLITLTLSGAQLKDLLEQQWQGDAGSRMLQVSSGFHYAWRASAPDGAHVDAGSMRLGDEPVRPEGRYRVTVNNFLAAGGDRFDVLKSGTGPVTGIIDTEALAAYLSAHQKTALVPITPERIERQP